MKILVTGANGQLGREIAKQGIAHDLVLTDMDKLDITDRLAVAKFIQEVKPEAVIHCAAYTNVDGAEADRDGAYRVNVVGTQNIAEACLKTEVRMIYISTDYVFDGLLQEPYRESHAVNPQSIYGHTKWQGEEVVRNTLDRHNIIRTAWLYGDGNNFVRTMLRLAAQNNRLRVVHDQVGTPTSTVDLTWAIFRLLGSNAYGTYHATCQGQCSWHEFACEIFKRAGVNVEVTPITTNEFVRPAKRPAYSVLDNYMLRTTVGDPLRPWQDALSEYIALLSKET